MRRLLGHLSLRARLLLTLALVLLAALSLGGVLTLQAGRQVGEQTLARLAEREWHILALSLTEPLILGDLSSVEQILRRAVHDSQLAWVELDTNGSVLREHAPERAVQRPQWFANKLAIGEIALGKPLTIGGRRYGHLRLAMATTAAEDRLWQLLSRVGLAALIGSAVLALAMLWIMRANLQGLIAIRQAARRLLEGETDAHVHLPVNAPPELRDTAKAVNAAQVLLRQQMEQLVTEKERWRVTLDSVGDAVVVTDSDGSVRFLNPVAERLTDWTEREAQGQNVEAVLPLLDDDRRTPIDNPARVLLREARDDSLQGQALLAARSGAATHVHYTAAPIHNDDGMLCGVVLVLRDDSERQAMLAELRRLAFHDLLTGLPNRRALEGRIERALKQLKERPERRHAFCYIDLDQFKLVNDTCGHAAGDQLLGELAGLMRACLPAPGAGGEPAVLGRLGGDEFGLLLFDTEAEAARDLAGRLIEAIRAHTYRHSGRDFQLGASAGIVLIAAGDDPGHVLARADAACYLAKRKGRNRVALWRPDDASLKAQSEEMEWIGRLERYYAERRFQLWRQRIAPVQAPAQAGYYEVLLRYIDTSGELRGPQELLTAAERYGLAPSLDRWVIRQLLGHLRDQPQDTARYAVNLSAQSLSDPHFVDFMHGEFAASGVDPGRIQLELTETAVIQDLDAARRFIAAMRQLGCGLALDDFGSGMSSFAYLKGLAADTLKIDGVFVRNLDVEPLDYVIVNAIAQVGRDFGLKTVAEFVENAAILERLAAIGVDYAQGYHLHRPEPFIAP